MYARRYYEIITEKDIQIRKEKIKLSLFVDDMMLYIDNPKDSTKNLSELLNKLNKVAGYK